MISYKKKLIQNLKNILGGKNANSNLFYKTKRLFKNQPNLSSLWIPRQD